MEGGRREGSYFMKKKSVYFFSQDKGCEVLGEGGRERKEGEKVFNISRDKFNYCQSEKGKGGREIKIFIEIQ